MQISVRSQQDPKKRVAIGTPMQEEKPKREKFGVASFRKKKTVTPKDDETATVEALVEDSDPVQPVEEDIPEVSAAEAPVLEEVEGEPVELGSSDFVDLDSDLQDALNKSVGGFAVTLLCSVLAMFAAGYFVIPVVLSTLGVLF